jgi:hypothetical protein
MQKDWQNLHVDLSALTQKVIQFLDSEKFGSIIDVETETGHKVIAGESPHYKMRDSISVTIEGEPDNFTVKLETTNEKKGPKLPMLIASMFGGGYLLVRDMKSEEAMLKFERDFWRKMSSLVIQAENSKI